MLLAQRSGQLRDISKKIDFRVDEALVGAELREVDSPVMPAVSVRPFSELVQRGRLHIRIHLEDAGIDRVELVPLEISTGLQQLVQISNDGSRILGLDDANQQSGMDVVVSPHQIVRDVVKDVPVFHRNIRGQPLLVGTLTKVIVEAVQLRLGELPRDIDKPDSTPCGHIGNGGILGQRRLNGGVDVEL